MPMRLLAVLMICILPLSGARAETFRLRPDSDIIGRVSEYTVEADDDIYGVARDFDLGLVEMMAANFTIGEWMPEEGTIITLPRRQVLPEVRREGIVINLAEQRLYFFGESGMVSTFPIGIGKEGWQTPAGETSVARKRERPDWIPPDTILAENPGIPRIVKAGPDNPLGEYAIDLAWPRFLIHGTNAPWGIGARSSHGCIRLYPEDIKTLFGKVSAGMKVTVIDVPYKLGWDGDTLVLEVTPSQIQADDIEQGRAFVPPPIPGINDAIRRKAFSRRAVLIDWDLVNAAVSERSGIPVAIAAAPPQPLLPEPPGAVCFPE